MKKILSENSLLTFGVRGIFTTFFGHFPGDGSNVTPGAGIDSVNADASVHRTSPVVFFGRSG